MGLYGPKKRLPAEVSERLVGFCHLMNVLKTLNSSTTLVCRINQLSSQLLTHRPAGALARKLNQPADCERLTTLRADLNRDLVVRTTNPTALNLE
jgi:hypothetical protein